jgi:tetratricopeptide (TPR) repeat protein
LATAQKAMNDLPNCIKTLESGLAIQSSNPDLKRMKKEVTELQRGEQVAAYCSKAQELMQNGDIPNAMKTLDLASRLDAGNPDIEAMMKKVKPKWETMEKKRKAGLGAVEQHKEKGDECYQNAQFEEAVGHYKKCIDQLVKDGEGASDLAVKAYSNRAGRLLFLEMFLTVLKDDGLTDLSRNQLMQLVTSKLVTLMVQSPIVQQF